MKPLQNNELLERGLFHIVKRVMYHLQGLLLQCGNHLCRMLIRPHHDTETWGLTRSIMWVEFFDLSIYLPLHIPPLKCGVLNVSVPLKTAIDFEFRVLVHDDGSQVLCSIFWIVAASGHCRCHGDDVCCVRTQLYPSGVSQQSPGGTLSSFLSPFIKNLHLCIYHRFFFFQHPAALDR